MQIFGSVLFQCFFHKAIMKRQNIRTSLYIQIQIGEDGNLFRQTKLNFALPKSNLLSIEFLKVLFSADNKNSEFV